jgi:hypothetical protein
VLSIFEKKGVFSLIKLLGELLNKEVSSGVDGFDWFRFPVIEYCLLKLCDILAEIKRFNIDDSSFVKIV